MTLVRGLARACLTAAALVAAPAPASPRVAGRAGRAERIEHRQLATAPSRGPATALVTIEVFLVPGPNMPATLASLQQLQERHPTRARLVYRILKGGAALIVPTAALEAQSEGKFFELMAELAKQHSATTPLKKDEVLELARKAGVDPQRVAVSTQFEPYIELLDANQGRFERLLRSASPPSVLFNSKPTRTSLTSISAADLDREYEAAYDRALDKLDRGYSVAELPQAFDDDAVQGGAPLVASNTTRDDDDRSPLDHPLARPPLSLEGLPSFGKPGLAAIVPIVVLCRPNDGECSNRLKAIVSEVRLYPEQVRIVWAPWFDVGAATATELTLLGDAALCAEATGSQQDELTSSAGWQWQLEMFGQISRGQGKKLAEPLIDQAASQLHLDRRALSACRARMAGTTLTWIAAARHAGVPPGNAAVVIGGRIYDGLPDQTTIHALVEAELAPGVLGSLPRWHTGK